MTKPLWYKGTCGHSDDLSHVIHLYRFLEGPTTNCHTPLNKNRVPQQVALALLSSVLTLNTSRPKQNGRHFPDESIFLNEDIWISNKISLKFFPKGPINNILVLVQILAWRRPGDKPLSDPMMARLLTHICVTRPQWVNSSNPDDTYG